MNTLSDLRIALDEAQKSPLSAARFYKTGPGEYAEQDKFIGVSVPVLREIAKTHQALSWSSLETLIASPFNEERLLALLILVSRYQQKYQKDTVKEDIYQFYLRHLKHVNNWNLVDASAHWIIGAHLHKQDKALLFTLVKSPVLWERRIAIVSTWYFIRQDDFKCTIALAEQLLQDEHDLMHKAVGWMLREVGKRDLSVLTDFLNHHAGSMPRTMLRYAIEKLPEHQRQAYLRG